MTLSNPLLFFVAEIGNLYSDNYLKSEEVCMLLLASSQLLPMLSYENNHDLKRYLVQCGDIEETAGSCHNISKPLGEVLESQRKISVDISGIRSSQQKREQKWVELHYGLHPWRRVWGR